MKIENYERDKIKMEYESVHYGTATLYKLSLSYPANLMKAVIGKDSPYMKDKQSAICHVTFHNIHSLIDMCSFNILSALSHY